MFTIVLIVGGCVAGVVVVLLLCAMCRTCEADSSKRMEVETIASKRSIRRFVITEKAPTRAFSWLKAATTAFTFKTLC